MTNTKSASNDNASLTAEETRKKRGEGEKYDRNLGVTDIAKLVRAELKTKVPGFGFSVRAKRFAGGRSLSVYITKLPEGVVLLNAARTAFETENPHLTSHSYPAEAKARYSAEVMVALAAAKAIVSAYNYDRSDSMSDYFDVNFYEHIEVDWEFERDVKVALGLR